MRSPSLMRSTLPDRGALYGPQLSRLRRMVEDIASELDLEPLLTRIVEHACALIGADDGTIGLFEPWRDAIQTVAVFNMPESELGSVMARGVGLAGEVLARGRPLMTRYGDISSATLPELAENHVIGLPVRWRGELVGFFGIGARPPRRFTRRDLAALMLFARYAAVAIVNARRYTSEHRRRVRFHLIARVAGIIVQDLARDEFLQRAADAIHELLGFPNVDIPLLDPADPDTLIIRIRGGRYKALIRREDRVPVSQGIMGAAVRERRTQLVNDVASDPRYLCPEGVAPPLAELAVPVRLGHEVLGIINVESDAPFDALDAESLEVVADYLALAINHARLTDAAREHAVLLERQRLAHELHDNVTQILASMNLLSKSLPGVWRRDPAEGERRSQRLGQLAQAAFAEMRALLMQLGPASATEGAAAGSALEGTELGRGQDAALPSALARLLALMVPPELVLRHDFARYRAQRHPHEQALLRVCQEAVSNVIRHAGASRLVVTAGVRGRHAVLRVTDNGVGFSEDQQSGGMGLASMRRRMNELGGRLSIRARRPRGTVVEAILPRADLEAPGA